ncbi:hypothetical protein VN97_g11935 [Penicillium thymicola]|uniref:Uncharacterized protein n=1 Tax=Penicillium thymicola TaxID=293382 RepID=A0AAI9T761_PENTH|nr:hypothetical protein VN97_g11935 [Penicillium thymicola]
MCLNYRPLSTRYTLYCKLNPVLSNHPGPSKIPPQIWSGSVAIASTPRSGCIRRLYSGNNFILLKSVNTLVIQVTIFISKIRHNSGVFRHTKVSSLKVQAFDLWPLCPFAGEFI